MILKHYSMTTYWKTQEISALIAYTYCQALYRSSGARGLFWDQNLNQFLYVAYASSHCYGETEQMPSFAKGCLTDAMSINKFTCPTWPRSAVGNVTGNRCESDCRSRVANSIPARSHIFVEIDHEIMSKVILLPSTESFKKGCCQLQAKVCARSTG